ncbi:MAG: sugar ABC transporter permease [Propionibacteriaceae bacterium]|nr:sugar ABC transporter permease [Propionibacteriaceae bacterium]
MATTPGLERTETSAPTPRSHHARLNRQQAGAGWLFVLPMVVVLGIFLFLPVVMAAWVSVADWTGRGAPWGSNVSFVGGTNYAQVLGGQGLAGRDFGTSIRNNLYYVILVVPLQTALSLTLAFLVNKRALKGKGFYRTAFYFPSVTSSVAITVLWLFLFSASGAINAFLGLFAITGPNWFQDPRGIIHLILGGGDGPAALQQPVLFGISTWEWLAGPSVAMCAFILMAIFTTSGTFMLLFLAALQAIGEETEEAAMVDGANAWQRFRYVTLPMLRPTVFTVLTLGTIGTWQVFDQIYTGTRGGPAKTTLTPAYLSYDAAFVSQDWGRGAAIAFVLFGIIVIFTIIQRLVLGTGGIDRTTRRELRSARLIAQASIQAKGGGDVQA